MTGTQLLDAAIGVVFVVLSFSLIASALCEALATALNWRGRMLRRGLFRLLEGAAGTDLIDRPFPGAARIQSACLTLALLADPAIRVLHGPRGRLPSAIPQQRFARALVDTLVRRVDLSSALPDAAPADAPALTALADRLEIEAVRTLKDRAGPLAQLSLAPDLKRRLRDRAGRLAAVREIRARLDGRDSVQAEIEVEIAELIEGAETRLHAVLADLGAWFEATMDRVSGWYVRRARLALFGLGVMLAASVNANLAALVGGVLRDHGLRAALVERAQDRLAAGQPLPRPRPAARTVEDLAAGAAAAREVLATLPTAASPGIGWACAADESWPACALRSLRPGAVISWLLIGLGCMTGGQFWYDFMGSVLRMRPAAGGKGPTGEAQLRRG